MLSEFLRSFRVVDFEKNGRSLWPDARALMGSVCWLFSEGSGAGGAAVSSVFSNVFVHL